MNTLVAVAIAPFGVGDELAPYVAEAIRVIRDSGLPYRTTSMFTEIEGDWDEVMAVVREATMCLTGQGIRTEVILKADIRPGHTDTLHAKVEKVEALLAEQESGQQPQRRTWRSGFAKPASRPYGTPISASRPQLSIICMEALAL